MIGLLLVLILGIIYGLFKLACYIIVGSALPFYCIGEIIWEHSQDGIAKKISDMHGDDFVALICNILRAKGFSNVRRDKRDMDIVLGERNGKTIMCICFTGNKYEITSKSINFAMNLANRYNVKKYVICYNTQITSAALAYAYENNVHLADAYNIAGNYIEAKRVSEGLSIK